MTMQQRVGVGHAALVATMMTMMVMVLPTGVHAVDAKAAPLRVMFVGNSFTFVNELPQQLVNIAQSKGVTIEVCAAWVHVVERALLLLLHSHRKVLYVCRLCTP